VAEGDELRGALVHAAYCTRGTPPHPWTVYVAQQVCTDLEAAVDAVSG
jgi:hypothetical protein